MYEGTITRRLHAVVDDLGEEFCFAYFRSEFQELLKELRAAKSNRPEVLSRLYEMLAYSGIPYEEGQSNHYYASLVEKAPLPGYQEVEDRILLALYRSAFQYLTPQAYMEAIVRRLSGGEWAGDPLRLRILKRFIREGRYLGDVVEIQYSADGQPKRKKDGSVATVGLIGGRQAIQNYVKAKTGLTRKPTEEEVLANLDDGVFAQLETAPESQKKSDGRLGLLKLAEDLASGNFHTGGATRRGLYLFAMVYGMSVYTGAEDQLRDYDSDVEKNLFRDYYSNNLLRFFSDAYREKLMFYERDPAGVGINYKNFAEMVYVYYLSSDLPIPEKLRRSSLMIQRIRRGKMGVKMPVSDATSRYRGRVVRTPGLENLFLNDLLEQGEEEFEQFLLANYDCNVRRSGEKGDYTVSVLELAREQRTAYKLYRDLQEKLKKLGVPLETCNYGLWFVDANALKRTDPAPEAGRGCWSRFCAAVRQGPDFEPERLERFTALLQGANGFLGCTVEESASDLDDDHERTDLSRRRNQAMFVPGPEAMTRTSLIVAYYYYYNALHEDDPDLSLRSFQTFFGELRQQIDPYLEQAGYLPFSGKNIFDVLVAFSAYAYCHTNL